MDRASALSADPIVRPRAYWICQASGWSLYVLVTIFQQTAETPLRRRLLEPMIAAAIGIALTHGLRKLARERRWPTLEAAALAPRVVLASFVLAAIHVALLAGVEMGAYGDRHPSVLLVIVFATIRWSMVFFIWQAIYFGHRLIEQRREGELRRVQAEKALQAAELRTLRAQLNPHFLFNSLNSIRALVGEDPRAAEDAITRIARILRYTLRAGREQTVAFERELEVVEDYLALEGLRLDERLVVTREIADDVGRIQIPIMALQILVENAIKHGVAHLPNGGVVRIGARRDDGALAIEVENPRPTKSPSSLATDAEGTSIGLANVAERLALLFGREATVSLDLSIADRATCTVRIPVERGST